MNKCGPTFHVYIYVHTHPHTHTSARAHTHTHAYTHAYTHTHACIHTHTQTHTHTRTGKQQGEDSAPIQVPKKSFFDTWFLKKSSLTFGTANPTWGDIFENSKLKARTSLLPHFSEKRRSSFEL